MKCPFCRQPRTDVYNTRKTRFANQVWRRRRCLNCNQSFTTYEYPDLKFLRVKPTSGRATPYSRARLFSSIYQSFADIPAKDTTIDAVTDTVEARLLDLRNSEITTRDVATIVLVTLKHFHTGAFLRYLTMQTHLVSDAHLRKELKKYS